MEKDFTIFGYIVLQKFPSTIPDIMVNWTDWHQHWSHKVYKSHKDAEQAIINSKRHSIYEDFEFKIIPVYHNETKL